MPRIFFASDIELQGFLLCYADRMSKKSDAIAELLSSPEGRRALSIQSPVFFDSYYCGMRFAQHREKWLEAFETACNQAKETQLKSKTLVLAPRDHGKTEAGITLIARSICVNRNVRCLWISESAGQAEKRMRRIKTLLESERVQEDWCSAPEMGCGPFRVTEMDKWTSTQVYVNRKLQSVDPTVEAVGSGGAVTGGHFDVIVCDDLEDDKTTFSQAQRTKTREWFRGTVLPMLVKGGSLILFGTRKHYDDLYSHLLDDPTFAVLQDKAISIWPDEYRFETETDIHGRDVVTGIQIEGDHKVLWPEERPLDYLLRERQTVGSRLFNREFQNEVIDDDTAAFRQEWLEGAKLRGRDYKLYQIPDVDGLEIVQGWDLALVTDIKGAETRDTDFTVGVTWARDAKGNRYLLGIFRKRGLTPAQLRGAVLSEYRKFGDKVRIVAVEKNNFGELHFLGLQRTTDLPLKPHLTTGKNKADPWEGVPAMGVLFENGKVVLPTGDPDSRDAIAPLVQELWGLGREKHDDCVMALWIAEMRLRKSAFVHSVSFGDDVHYEATAEEREIASDILSDGERAKQYDDGIEQQNKDTLWDFPWFEK